MRESDHHALPTRNLIRGMLMFGTTGIVAVVGYMLAGWPFSDALYMVVITVFSVGYGEIRPIDTPELRFFTMGVIAVGCVSIIYVTGSLVQFLTAAQLRHLMGERRMNREISKLRGHTIVCGFGRLGRMVATDLQRSRKPFVILDRSPLRLEEAREMGCLTVAGDATDEKVLMEAGVKHATSLATVLPDDAANVFITLSARNLSSTLRIIARGEVPSTENKLLQAGATHVVLPAHIGAERVSHLLLFADAESGVKVGHLDEELAGLGVTREEMLVPESSFAASRTIAEITAHAAGDALLVALLPQSGGTTSHPAAETVVQTGDALVWLVREGRLTALNERFAESAEAELAAIS